MSLRTVWAPLRRHGLMPALVFMQVTLACAILSNVLFLSWQKLEPMLASTGVDAANLVLIDNLASMQRAFTANDSDSAEQALRNTPGVRAASSALGLPMVGMMVYAANLHGANGVTLSANGYLGRGLVQTLGLHLIEGRDFLPTEYHRFGINTHEGSDDHSIVPIIITRSLERQLFGSASGVGKLLNDPDDKTSPGYVVVGVVDHLLRNQLGLATNGRADNTFLLAKHIGATAMLSFAVRIEPTDRAQTIARIKQTIQRQFGTLLAGELALPRVETYQERRDASFASARASLWLLIGVTIAIVIVTLVGIAGLTGFWVQRRTRQIGVRRALGARRGDILRYFLLENALIVGLAVLLGMLLAFVTNALLMHYYELPRLPWAYLPVGAVTLLLMGQLGVLAPALRAAAVPPVVATRSV